MDLRTGTYQKAVDYNKYIANSTILNDVVNKEDSESGTITLKDLIDQIKTEYEGDTISTIPSCACGRLNKPHYRNRKWCDFCGTLCTTITSHPIKADMFIRPPKGIKKLIRPVYFQMLCDFFTKSKFNVITYLTNRGESANRFQDIANVIENLGIKRGYNSFYENFEDIINKLMSAKLHRNVSKAVKEEMYEWILSNKEDIFVDYLPIPSKITFVTEVTPLGKYVDGTIKDALDSICSILNIDEGDLGTALHVKENRTGKAIHQLSRFYYQYIKTHINPKEGWARQHMFGTMTDFTGYCVISSKTRNVDGECIQTPWSYSVGLLKMHIFSKLINKYPTKNGRKLYARITRAISTYDPLIHDIMNELIEESPHKGLPALVLRNPSLDKLSIQCLFINEIKTDITDRTLSIPINNTKGWNADKFLILFY